MYAFYFKRSINSLSMPQHFFIYIFCYTSHYFGVDFLILLFETRRQLNFRQVSMIKDASPLSGIVHSFNCPVDTDLFEQLSVSDLTVPDIFFTSEPDSLLVVLGDTFCTVEDSRDGNVALADVDNTLIFSKMAEIISSVIIILNSK